MKKSKREKQFAWDAWDFDGDGDAYIIAKTECPQRAYLPQWIAEADRLPNRCIPRIDAEVEEGWCKFQVRSDWEDRGPSGWYVVETCEKATQRPDGRRKPGWFPVWIVRKKEWY